MHRSLSGYLRDQLQRRYDGPIPGPELRRVEELACVERALDGDMAPIERALRRVADDYGDLLRETARLEATRQILAETHDRRREAEYRKRLALVLDSGRALEASNAQLLALARAEAGADS